MKKIDYFIKKYLENRPMFLAIIRSQEAILFQKYNQYIKGKILDFGCGDGFFAKIVFGKGKIDVGLDLKNSRAKEAEKNKIYKKVVYYDGETIPFPDNYFSTVISNCVLEHISNLKNSLKEIKRVLKPGGYFLTTVMIDKWEDYLFGKKIFGQNYVNFMRKKQKHFNLLSKNQWIALFKINGFEVINVHDYLTKKQSEIVDIFHYLSLPSLVSYKIFHRWTIWRFWYKLLFIDKFIEKILERKKITNGAAIFISCKKLK